MAEVSLEGVEKFFGDFVAVRSVDLTVRPGEFVTLLGASGAGKSTCLRIVAGFIAPSSGRILIDGRDVTGLPPYRRNTGMVFQSYALFPHQTVAANVSFGLRVRRRPRAEIAERVEQALRLVHLEKLADRYPAQLSGGERQRVALARAVVIRPTVLLLDEPLAALDLKLREALQVEIKRIQTELKMTTLFVTHDQGEALGMSDRVGVMRDGAIIQIDTPTGLYERPNSRYVANFVGRTNLIEVVVRAREDQRYKVEATGAGHETFTVSGAHRGAFSVGEHCLLAARPENFAFGTAHSNVTTATMGSVVYRGSITTVELEGGCGENFAVVARAGEKLPERGSLASISWRPDSCFLLKQE
jgi:ABC-type Fe3+/spermidine/putrescine transport system ATPase subunit